MDTGSIDQNQVILHTDVIPIAKSIRPVLDILEPSLIRQARNVEVDADERLFVRADDVRLRQVILNILSNALKYTPPSSNIAITTEVIPWNQLVHRIPERYHQQRAASDTIPCVVLLIRDWGAGISPEYQEQLFERFMRLPDEATRTQRGSGLGLYLCRQLMDAMNGCIWVESKAIVGEGTTFLIAFPQQMK